MPSQQRETSSWRFSPEHSCDPRHPWLAETRSYLQWHCVRGDSIHWGSEDVLHDMTQEKLLGIAQAVSASLAKEKGEPEKDQKAFVESWIKNHPETQENVFPITALEIENFAAAVCEAIWNEPKEETLSLEEFIHIIKANGNCQLEIKAGENTTSEEMQEFFKGLRAGSHGSYNPNTKAWETSWEKDGATKKASLCIAKAIGVVGPSPDLIKEVFMLRNLARMDELKDESLDLRNKKSEPWRKNRGFKKHKDPHHFKF